jgi:hypothetical protein
MKSWKRSSGQFAPFKHGAPPVRIAGAHDRVNYTRQGNEESNQKIT